ncbi:MAG TPA: M36 family metallopeptidase [Saprospiraceae bacterium]|nr:M36 family metallopeptidase [Saprospiraceae bacterium]
MRLINKYWFFSLVFFLSPVFLLAQINALGLAKDHLQMHPGPGQWTISDFAEAEIVDQYRSQHNDVLHVYVRQQYQRIPVYNAIAAVHLRGSGKKVLYQTNRFYDQLSERIATSVVKIPAERALYTVSDNLGIPLSGKPQVTLRSARSLQFLVPELSDSPVPAEQIYFPAEDGKIYLCWNLRVDDSRSAAVWNIFVDAESGVIRNKKDETIYCTFKHTHDALCTIPASRKQRVEARSNVDQSLVDGATYFVFPASVESPNHGDRSYVVNPADAVASPFGWHDTNGVEGPEYTFTRGNNVHAYRDADPDDEPDGPEPEGGEELFFEFPYTIAGSPTANSDAAVTQLFYMNNFMHDFTYYFGFDEESGNYQQNNYGKGGRQGDPVRAEAQDGSGLNNANFTPSPDGTNGKMQMFLWSFGGNSNFNVNAPSELAGGYPYATAEFGPQIIETIDGELVSGITDTANTNTGCTSLINESEVKGKIVLIDRGDCFFEEKAVNAEEAGAIACVICNNTTGLIQMGGLDTLPDPSIPTIMVRQSDCARFRSALQSGPVEVSIEAPDFLDSDFDNGIIAHEYGHGISTRLTGGPSSPFCLTNNEQMGEGWSDFFTLVVMAQEGDQGVEPRAIGTFPSGQSVEGSGIRRQRYSTDRTVNDQTYDDVIGTFAPHPLGEVWAATLWDIYWAFADRYGYDPDPSNREAGNNIAIQLVMDGMKLQSCDPGFIDGRDGIIAADLINNGGANECLLWEIFSQRGLGWSAEQGESANRNDNIEAYDQRPACIQELKISKSSTPNIQPGEIFDVSIMVVNDKVSSLSEVVVEDIIPVGTQLVPGSTSGATLNAIDGDRLIFELGSIGSSDQREITYQLESDPALFSSQLFFDGAEGNSTSWSPSDLTGNDIWKKQDIGRFAGDFSWFVPNTERTNDQVLRLLQSVRLDAIRPVLRFYHRYDIQPGLDGAIVEISTNGISWQPVPEELFFREPFVGRAAQSTFGLSKQKAFWGNSQDFVASYIDLRDYVGEDLLFRFRFSSNEDTNNSRENYEGWYVDNIEVMDMVNYATEVCVRSAEGDNICVPVAENGTIVETNLATNTQASIEPGLDLRIFPNPVSSQLNVQIKGTSNDPIRLRLLSLDGKELLQRQLSSGLALQSTTMDMRSLAPGVYLLNVKTATENRVEKIVVQ